MDYMYRWKSSLDAALVQFGSISIKQFIILTLASTFLAVIIILLRYMIFGKKMDLKNFFALLCLIVYINIIAQLALLGRKPGSRIGVDLSLYKGWGSKHVGNVSLIRTYSILNVIFFVPYGVIISLFNYIEKQKRVFQMVIGGLIVIVTSMTIEILQYITQRGYFEIDDLLCNTLGGLIGCVFVIGVRTIMNNRTRMNNHNEGHR